MEARKLWKKILWFIYIKRTGIEKSRNLMTSEGISQKPGLDAITDFTKKFKYL